MTIASFHPFYLYPPLSVVLSIILMVVIRYISVVLVWILTALVVLGSIGKLPVHLALKRLFLHSVVLKNV